MSRDAFEDRVARLSQSNPRPRRTASAPKVDGGWVWSVLLWALLFGLIYGFLTHPIITFFIALLLAPVFFLLDLVLFRSKRADPHGNPEQGALRYLISMLLPW